MFFIDNSFHERKLKYVHYARARAEIQSAWLLVMLLTLLNGRIFLCLRRLPHQRHVARYTHTAIMHARADNEPGSLFTDLK